ncbi:hypothetical protein JHK87_044633 [Glycine soja]|nr:hypothetical protein JHK87_044633 [Glycine soja]
MSTWEDLDNSSSDEDGEEEANLCLMANAFTSKADPALDVSLDDKDSQPDDIANSDGEEALLDEKVSSGCKSLLKDFQDLEEKVKSLTTTLEDSEEWHKEMLKQKLLLQKECTLANDELDNLKKKDSDLWMECQHDKKMAFDLNCKHKGHELENGEFVPPEKPVMMSRRSEIENGEIAGERWKKGEVERGEFVSGKWRKEELLLVAKIRQSATESPNPKPEITILTERTTAARASTSEFGVVITISKEEFDSLSHKVEESDKLADMKVATAKAQVEAVKASENEALKRLEKTQKKIEDIKTATQEALKKAEMAEAAKRAMEKSSPQHYRIQKQNPPHTIVEVKKFEKEKVSVSKKTLLPNISGIFQRKKNQVKGGSPSYLPGENPDGTISCFKIEGNYEGKLLRLFYAQGTPIGSAKGFGLGFWFSIPLEKGRGGFGFFGGLGFGGEEGRMGVEEECGVEGGGGTGKKMRR